MMRVFCGLCLLLSGLGLAGCASEPAGAAHPPKPSPKLLVVPVHTVVGRVIRVNPVGQFAILGFPVGVMPAPDQRLSVYRGPLKVGEVKVSGRPVGQNIAADLLEGDCAPGDEVRDR